MAYIFAYIILPKKALDYLAIGVHELANMSERRLERLVNPGVCNVLHTCIYLEPWVHIVYQSNRYIRVGGVQRSCDHVRVL